MTSQAIATSLDVSNAFAEASIQVNDRCSHCIGLGYDIETFSKDIEKTLEMDKIYDTTLKIFQHNDMTRTSQERVETPRPSTDITLQKSSTKTPLTLSPRSSRSSSPSPGSYEPTWDTAQTPLHLIDQAHFDFPTPLTASSTFDEPIQSGSFFYELVQTTPSRARTGDYENYVTEQDQVQENSVSKIRSFRMMVNSSQDSDDHVSAVNSLDSSKLISNGTLGDITATCSTIVHHSASPTATCAISGLDATSLEIPVAHLHDKLVEHDGSVTAKSSPHIKAINVQATDEPVPEIGVLTFVKSLDRIDLDTSKTATKLKVTVREAPLPGQPRAKLFNYQPPTDQEASLPVVNFSYANISFDFGSSQDEVRNTKQTSQNELPHDKSECTKTQAKGASATQTSRKFENFHKILEHIIPFKIRARMMDDPNRCVATKVNEPYQCRSPAHGDLTVAYAATNAIAKCITTSNYIAILDHVEKLVVNTMCLRHRAVALSREVARPRLDTLHDLILSLPNVLEENILTFGNWLKAISNTDASSTLRAVPADQGFTAGLDLADILDTIMPFQTRAFLSRYWKRCVVSGCEEMLLKEDDGREEHLLLVDACVKSIAQCAKRAAYTALPYHLERLVGALMCCTHKVRACSHLALLQAIIRNVTSLPSHHVSAFRAWMRAVTSCDSLDFPQLVAEKPTTGKSIAVQAKSYKAGADAGVNTTLFSPKFTPYQSGRRSNQEIADDLMFMIRKPLSENDELDGFIYMFWDQQFFGMIKIGRTADLKKRLKGWNKHCQVTHRYHESGKPQLLPHVQRIEKLVHTELTNYRKKRVCDGCGKNHIEWFDIDEAKARQVYRKWQDWIMQRPYDRDDTGKWNVRPEMLRSLSEVCTPVVFSDTDFKKVRPRQPLAKGQPKQRTPRKTI